MASRISQSSSSSISQYKSQWQKLQKKCISSALLQSPLSCGRNLGLTQFSFFLSLSFFVSGQVGEEKEEKSPIVCTSCSHIWRCCSSIRSLFYLLQRERRQNKLSSTLFPERQKVKVCGLWHFKVVSGQRTESECLLQLPARGGRWIQS